MVVPATFSPLSFVLILLFCRQRRRGDPLLSAVSTSSSAVPGGRSSVVCTSDRPAPGKPYTSPFVSYFLFFFTSSRFPAALLASITGRVVPRRKGPLPSFFEPRACVFFCRRLSELESRACGADRAAAFQNLDLKSLQRRYTVSCTSAQPYRRVA